MKEKKVKFSYFIILTLDNGGHKKCVTVDSETTVTIEAKPDIKSFSYDFVGDENIE